MRSSGLAILSLLCSSVSIAQVYPSSPVRIIVPYAPGGSVDILARTTGQQLQKLLETPIVIENISGVGGATGSRVVAQAAPNGYTLGIASPGSHSIPVALGTKLPYDPMRDFSYIGVMAKYVSVLVVNPAVPANSMAELIAYAKKNPDKLTYASAGIATTGHLLGETLKDAAQIRMIHLPSSCGTATGLRDLIGGHMPVGILSIASVASLIKSEKLRALAVFENERYREFPDIPSLKEVVPNIDLRPAWYGLVGPAGIPVAIVNRLHDDAQKTVRTPEIRSKLESVGLEILGGSSQEFASLVKDDIASWTRVVKVAGIRVE